MGLPYEGPGIQFFGYSFFYPDNKSTGGVFHFCKCFPVGIYPVGTISLAWIQILSAGNESREFNKTDD